MVVSDRLYRKIVAQNNTYGVILDAFGAADLLPRLVFGMEWNALECALHGVNSSTSIDPTKIFALRCGNLR